MRDGYDLVPREDGMKYPDSKGLGYVRGPEGRNYSQHFYGENEGMAVITGPSPESGRMEFVKEVHREPAVDADDARTKLEKWRREQGWPED